MSKLLPTAAMAAIAAAMLGLGSAQAAPVSANLIGNPMLIHVSGGCGPYGWRGPHGHCNSNRGWRGGPNWRGNGCPYGSWRGPWGHCRNTPYHGRLPGGGWKP
ncbi:MAG TPA: hypothetical protein VII42_06260 [Caulobacteraceae bacterium]